MTSTFECTLEWLQLKLPHLGALVSGVLLTTFGLGSLGLMVGVLAPASLVTWLPLIVLFCSANGGYKLGQKRAPGSEARLAPYLVALAGWAFVLAAAFQAAVDNQLFHTSPSGLTLAILAGCALAGTWMGHRLRRAFERLGHQGS
jgi:hypothetical protein